MDYIKAEDIINEVKLNLKSYFESAIVDESILYPEILNCLGELGVKFLPKKTMVFQLTSKETKLPSDFHSLIFAAACDWKTQKLYKPPVAVTYQKRVCELPICHTECDYCHDEFGRYQIVQKIDQSIIRYKLEKQLILDAESTQCDSCFNPKHKSQWDISITDGILSTQINTGTVYMEYRTKLEADGSIIIPDFSRIRNWLKWHLIHHVLQLVWYNMDGDTYQRYQDAKRELHIAKENAKAFYKMYSFQEFTELKKMLRKEFNNLSKY